LTGKYIKTKKKQQNIFYFKKQNLQTSDPLLLSILNRANQSGPLTIGRYTNAQQMQHQTLDLEDRDDPFNDRKLYYVLYQTKNPHCKDYGIIQNLLDGIPPHFTNLLWTHPVLQHPTCWWLQLAFTSPCSHSAH
jgi:hypothetical protein